MAAPVMPAADTLTRTLLAARDADWGDWSADAVRAGLAALGWPVLPAAPDGPPGAPGARADTGVAGLTCAWNPEAPPGGPALEFEVTVPVEPAPLPVVHGPSPYAPPGLGGAWGLPAGAYIRDRERELDAAHNRLVASLTAVLGPAPWRGGPGAWLRWRGRETTLRIERVAGAATLRMAVFPTRIREEAERRAFTEAPGVAGLPYDWCLTRPDSALAELFLPLGPDPADLGELAARLPEVLAGVVTDLPLVGWGEPVLIVVADVRGRDSAELRVGQDRLEIGGVPGTVRRVWLRPGPDEGRAAGRMLLAAFDAWRVDRAPRLRLRTWTSGGYVDLPGLGILPEGCHPEDLGRA